MRRTAALRFIAILVFGALGGWGCTQPAPYIPAPETAPVAVPANAEGAKASTGGQGATITPILDSGLLAAVLPKNGNGWTATGDAAELKNPVPSPDGTRAEYVGVTREYEGAKGTIRATLTDTRGIPALTAFLEGYAPRQSPDEYRSQVPVGNTQGWMTYTYGPNREQDGSGSLVFLVRDRFLVQLDGSPGVSAEALATFAERFDLSPLR